MKSSIKFLLPFAAAVVKGSDVSALPYLNADPDTITVSGTSAGGQYSNHLLTVLSDSFKGAGISKGTTFDAKFWWLKNQRTWPAEALSDHAIETIDDLHSRGEIDDIANLQERAVYIISGGEADDVVPPHNQLGVKQ